MTENFGSFSFDVTRRILVALIENGTDMKKTNLATKTGLNYNVCMRYIGMLQVLGWLEVAEDVSITEIGRQINAKLNSAKGMAAAACNYDDVVQIDRVSNGSNSKPYVQQQQQTKNAGSFQTATTTTAVCKLKPTEKSTTAKKDGVGIMIVDDEPDVALTYESFLASKGYNVKSFSDTYEALREFASKGPSYYHLAFLDIRMPGINGIQLYQSLKAMNPACKIIFVSSLDAASELVSILPSIRPQDVIRKPVDRERFVQTVKAILG